MHETAAEYGILHSLPVSRESAIRFETNRYSVPEQLMGLTLSVRVAAHQIRISHQGELVAIHRRSFQKRQFLRELSHYEQTLARKPRARVMAYREKLLELGSVPADYVTAICRRDRPRMEDHILRLYALWQEAGTKRFVTAVDFCHQRGVYGAAYVELLLKQPPEELSPGKPCQTEKPCQASDFDGNSDSEVTSGEEPIAKRRNGPDSSKAPETNSSKAPETNKSSDANSQQASNNTTQAIKSGHNTHERQACLEGIPSQAELDRDLAVYESYVHGYRPEASDTLPSEELPSEELPSDAS